MLRPAQRYEEELNSKWIRCWYNPDYLFYGDIGQELIDVAEDNFNVHQFVSVDERGQVIGYISYNINWNAKSASQLGVVSFEKGNLKFCRDIAQAIDDIFGKYHLNRLEWFCYVGNPAIRSYRNFIKRYGGRECGYYRQAVMLQDGTLHDCVAFEILAEEFSRRNGKFMEEQK